MSQLAVRRAIRLVEGFIHFPPLFGFPNKGLSCLECLVPLQAGSTIKIVCTTVRLGCSRIMPYSASMAARYAVLSECGSTCGICNAGELAIGCDCGQ